MGGYIFAKKAKKNMYSIRAAMPLAQRAGLFARRGFAAVGDPFPAVELDFGYPPTKAESLKSVKVEK